jgi:hypothetical protein
MVGRSVRSRFWVEAVLAAVGLLAGVVTLVVPDWIERLGAEVGDNGSGSTERLVALVVIAAALSCAMLARIEWRRTGVVTT